MDKGLWDDYLRCGSKTRYNTSTRRGQEHEVRAWIKRDKPPWAGPLEPWAGPLEASKLFSIPAWKGAAGGPGGNGEFGGPGIETGLGGPMLTAIDGGGILLGIGRSSNGGGMKFLQIRFFVTQDLTIVYIVRVQHLVQYLPVDHFLEKIALSGSSCQWIYHAKRIVPFSTKDISFTVIVCQSEETHISE